MSQPTSDEELLDTIFWSQDKSKKLEALKARDAAKEREVRIDTMHTAWARALHGVNSGDDLTLIREYIKSEFDAAQKELVELRTSDHLRHKDEAYE